MKKFDEYWLRQAVYWWENSNSDASWRCLFRWVSGFETLGEKG